ncbi:MAG: DUF4330 family protein [Clostridia bacterium]|nr:DUF4330 family protein [Clostridia bacterium]
MSNKTKLRFNGIDLMIIILIVGCIAGLALRYQLINVIRADSDSKSAKVSFYLSNIRSTSEDYFNEGDRFYIAGENEEFGTLESGFVFEPAAEYHMKNDGVYVKTSSVNGRSDMYGSVKAKGLFTEDGEFLLNGTKYIAPGSELSLYSGNIEITVMLTNVEPIA